jgi:hypothetical chaperone protein
MASCGLDFGTSNTTLGLAGARPRLARLEGEAVTIPSAIFFDWSAQALVGRAANAAYVEGRPGRLLRSLKSALGGPLIDEATQVGRKRLRFTQVIAAYLGRVKEQAERDAGRSLTQVVHGRPVHFVDDDSGADAHAQETLAQIARDIGFRDVSFQYEPIAAALDYERDVNGEEIALVADVGGGTADFSIVRLGPDRRARAERSGDVLASAGARVGGVDYDRRLSLAVVMPLLGFGSPMRRAGLDAPSGYFHDLATWSSIHRVYDQKTVRELREVRRESMRPELIERLLRVVESQRGHTIAIDVERAKIALSDLEASDIDLGWLEEGLCARADRAGLVASASRLTARIVETVEACLRGAGVKGEDVDALFLTGGTTQIPHVREAIARMAPSARVVEGDTFGSVGAGLAIEAQRRYG